MALSAVFLSAMGANGLVGDGFANAFVRSCAAAIAQSAEDGG